MIDDYWEQGYGRIIMVPRVKLAYDKVSPLLALHTFTLHSVSELKPPSSRTWPAKPLPLLEFPEASPRKELIIQKVYDIIHPERRNLTAIRGYKRIGGLPDDPRTDPQDRSWYGPHDRLFTEEEDLEVDFQPGPKHGKWSPGHQAVYQP